MTIPYPFMDIAILAQQFYSDAQYMRGYAPKTITRYQLCISQYRSFANITAIHEVSEANVRALLFHGRTERKWSANTFISYHKSLHVFFQWCIKQGHLANDPTTHIELPRLMQQLPNRLSKAQAMFLLEVVQNYPYEYHFVRYRNHALFSMLLFAGLRKGELLKLTCTDVDIENLTVFVRQGKGGKDRIIPMSFTLAHSLKRYMQERKRLNRTCPSFFVSGNRNMGFTENGLKHLVNLFRTASKIRFTIHQLRHTFATLMLEGGCDIYSLSRMMGHSDIKTTTIYLSASAEHLRSQIVKHPLNGLVA